MIDPKKVRLMTKLAVYEEGPGKKDLKINCYSKRTYVNIKQLESIIAITVAYLLGLGFVLLWNIHRYYFTGIEVPLSEIYSSCDDSLSDNNHY